MHPILLKIGPITIYTYGVMAALAIAASYALSLHLADLSGISRKDMSDIFFWAVVSGFVGARLFFFLYNPQYARPIYRILFFWQGGLVWFGGFIFGLLTVIYMCRKRKIPLWKIGDIAGVVGSLGLAIGRIGCTMAGCCYGKICHSHFAIVFKNPYSVAPLNVPLYPTQPISSLANFLIAAVLYLDFRKKKKDGETFGLYLILYGIFRFLIEFWRATPKIFWGFSDNQIISALMVLAGILIFYRRRFA